MQNLTILQFFTSIIVGISAHGARNKNVGEVLEAACSSKSTAPGAYFRWMILFSSENDFPQSMVVAIRAMQCAYEVRTIEMLHQWNTSDHLPSTDYKVIAVGMAMKELRRTFDVFVSLLRA